jgi:NADH-quinone oxidoreductase subunit F
MPAQHEEVEAAEHEGIALLTGLAVVAVESRDGETSGLRVVEQRATGEIDRGRAVWAPVPGTERVLPAATILVAIGEEPDPSILPEGVAMEVSGFASVVADTRAAAPGHAKVFAGGDFVSGPATVIDAVASGRRAAGSIHEHLSGATDGEAEILATVRYRTPPEPSLALDIAPRSRVHLPLPIYRAGSFTADQAGFDESQARSEASRCFRCDAVYGCGTVQVLRGRGPRETGVPAMPPPADGPPGIGGPAMTGGEL